MFHIFCSHKKILLDKLATENCVIYIYVWKSLYIYKIYFLRLMSICCASALLQGGTHYLAAVSYLPSLLIGLGEPPACLQIRTREDTQIYGSILGLLGGFCHHSAWSR